MEKFLPGREFTALVVGDKDQGVYVYPVVERVFKKDLEEHQRILGFDRYWSGYDLDGGKPKEEDRLYYYALAPAPMMVSTPLSLSLFQVLKYLKFCLKDRLKALAKDAYLAMDGNGYGRVDMRSDAMEFDAPVYVLEVNANCSLSFDLNSSVGEVNLFHCTKFYIYVF